MKALVFVLTVFVMCGAMSALGGCASTYSVPGMAADFRAMGITQEEADSQTDVAIARRLDRKPLARFPTSIAIVRVQGSGYRSHTARGYGSGCYSVVTTRDVESQESLNRLASLPMVAGVAPLNRLVLPAQLNDEQALRAGAANVQADMLLIYTFDTIFETDKKIAPLGLLTLGLFPDRDAHVTSTAIAALVDTRNGYVYGLAEATGTQSQLTNAWNSDEAVDASRRLAEKQAFDSLVNEVESMWTRIAVKYGPASASRATSALIVHSQPE